MRPKTWPVMVLLCFSACDSGDGEDSCTDECIMGDMVCFENDIRECGNWDSDECLDWKITPCTSSEICLDLECQNIDEISTASLELSITDQCDDGYYIEYRFFDVDHDLIWPDADSYYHTLYYNQAYTSYLSCIPNAKICYGGNTGSMYWGLGLEGEESCESCCVDCIDGTSFDWNLTCY